VEATSGRTITVESLQMNTGVFHDREYNFDSLGHFTGKTFIKYSNDDKHTDHIHVMTKMRTVEPLTVYIVKLESQSLPWLQAEGYERSSYTGVSFSGVRETRHKEWDSSLLTTDHFAAEAVWSKTFPAGTISIPGNNGGDGSFLIFLDRPGACDAMAHMMIQGCNNSPRDIEPGCNVADVRCCGMDGATCNSGNFPQTFSFLDGITSEGAACEAGACRDTPDTWCHSAVTFSQAQEICAANGERLCTRAEIQDDVCCGNGCGHNGHLIWFSDELPPAQCAGNYEAEEATLHGAIVHADSTTAPHQGFTGSSFVDYLNPNGDYIEWTLPRCSSGAVTLAFRYALQSGDRPLAVYVNGVSVTDSLSFPATGAWSNYGTVQVTATLAAGTNVVKLLATGASGANMDSLTVSEAAPLVDAWTVVQGAATSPHAGVNMGADAFNTMFAACPVVRYTNPAMNGSPAVYKRHHNNYPGDAHSLFTHLWAKQDNQFHSDFDIYPSLDDARAGTSPWSFCNFSDEPQPNHFTVGFPRDCGPAGYQPHIWFHATRATGSQTQGYFEIYTGNNCPV
jgi:hypothetical protein